MKFIKNFLKSIIYPYHLQLYKKVIGVMDGHIVKWCRIEKLFRHDQITFDTILNSFSVGLCSF